MATNLTVLHVSKFSRQVMVQAKKAGKLSWNTYLSLVFKIKGNAADNGLSWYLP